jgi:molecular chaperone GrpE
MTEKNIEDEDNVVIETVATDENFKLQEEITALKDRIVRNAAELENMRKRCDKQIEEAREYATFSFAKDLISITDNLNRALAHIPEDVNDEIKSITQGVEMIFAEFKTVLVKHHIYAIEAQIGDRFDYNTHQAIAQVPTDKYPKGHIVDIMQTGYKLKERLLRPVVVAISDTINVEEKNGDENV